MIFIVSLAIPDYLNFVKKLKYVIVMNFKSIIFAYINQTNCNL